MILGVGVCALLEYPIALLSSPCYGAEVRDKRIRSKRDHANRSWLLV